MNQDVNERQPLVNEVHDKEGEKSVSLKTVIIYYLEMNSPNGQQCLAKAIIDLS